MKLLALAKYITLCIMAYLLSVSLWDMPKAAVSRPLLTTVGGAITTNTTWTTSGSPYVLTSHVTVKDNIVLTIEPGVVVKSQGGRIHLDVDAQLIANGTGANPIVFTSYKDDAYGGDTNSDGQTTLPNRGDWGGISANHNTVVQLQHVLIRYGAYSLSVEGSLNLHDSTIEQSNYDGVVIYTASSSAPVISIERSTIQSNDGSGITVSQQPNSLAIRNTTIRNNRLTALILNGVTTAEITDNTIVVPAETEYNYTVSGISATDANNNLVIRNNRISRDSSVSFHNTGIHLQRSAAQLINNQVNGFRIAVNVSDGYPQVVPTYSGNNFQGNKYNTVGVSGGITGGTWTNFGTLNHLIYGYAYLQAGVSLVIPAGNVIKFAPTDSDYSDEGGSLYLSTGAQLIAVGTATQPIIFTSVKDDAYGGDTNNDGSATLPAPNNWRGLFGEGASAFQMQHVLVRYGTGISTSGSIVFQDSTIEKNFSTGISAYPALNSSATVRIERSVIREHVDNYYHSFNGISVYGQPGTLIIQQNTIANNGNFGITLGNVSNAQISNNTITLAANYYGGGIALYEVGSGVVVRDNQITHDNSQQFAGTGIEIGSGAPQLINNRVRGFEIAVGISGGYPQLVPTYSGNDFTGNHYSTIGVWGNLKGGTWTNFGGYTHFIAGSASLENGASLTIPAGTVVKFRDAGSLILGTGAQLTAIGAQANPIVLTSITDDQYGGDTNNDGGATQPYAGNWQWLSGGAASNMQLQHVIIRYPRSVSTSGSFSLLDSTLANISETGLQISPAANTSPTILIERSLIEHTGYDAITVYNQPSSLLIRNNTFRNASQYANDRFQIRLSSINTAQLSGNNFAVSGYGHGLMFENCGANVVVVNNTLTRNGAQNTNAKGIELHNSSPQLTNNQVHGFAMAVGIGNGYPQFVPTYTNNDFAGNHYSTIGVWGAIKNGAWTNSGGYNHFIAGDSYIDAGATLTITAGTSLKFLNGGIQLQTGAKLVALGSSKQPVVFTSIQDDMYGGDTNNDGAATMPSHGSWGGIHGDGLASSIQLRHARIRYGGGWNYWRASVSAVANLLVQDSVIELGGSRGIYLNPLDGTAPAVRIERSLIQNHWDNGIEIARSIANLTIKNNTIANNGSFGLNYQNGNSQVDATHNWWGDPSGPLQELTNPDGKGNAVSDRVSYKPWLWYAPQETVVQTSTLAVGSVVTVTVEAGRVFYFAVPVEAAKNLLVTVDRLDGQEEVQVLLSQGKLPAPYHYDQRTRLSSTITHGELPVGPTLAGSYYVLLHAPFMASGSLRVVLGAAYTQLHLSSVAPNQGANAGDLTVNIKGTGFEENTTVTLVAPSGQKLASRETLIASSISLFTTFDLRNAESGSYRLDMTRPSDGRTASLANAVQIGQGEPGRLKVSLEGPDVVRPGRVYSYKLHYENVGGTDIPAPFISLSTSNSGATFYVDGFAGTQVLLWLAGGENSPGNLLPPGDGGQIAFKASMEQDMTLNVNILAEAETPFEWSAVEARIKPDDIPEDEWQALWDAAKTNIGTTQQEVLSFLRSLGRNGHGAISFDELLTYALFFTAHSLTASSNSDVLASDAQGDLAIKVYDPKKDVVIVPPPGGYHADRKLIVITHGWVPEHFPIIGCTAYDFQDFEDLANRLSGAYGEEYDVVQVRWWEGACSLPLIGAWAARKNIEAAAEEALVRLRSIGYSNWEETIYIGHSFGNAVNAYISAHATKKGSALILNAANTLGFFKQISGGLWWLSPANYERSFVEGRSLAIQTSSIADSQLWPGHRTIFHARPDCSGKACSNLGKHGAIVRFVTCLLHRTESEPNCGLTPQNKTIAHGLIENRPQDLGINNRPGYDACFGMDNNQILHLFTKDPGLSLCLLQGSLRSVVVDDVAWVTGTIYEQVIAIVRSIDPNDKFGPTGLGAQRVVPVDAPLYYTINFENASSATAPVQELVIVDQLDPNLDWSTFQFTEIAYGERVIPISQGAGVLQYQAEDTPPASVIAGTTQGDMIIKINATVNAQTGSVIWRLRAIDSATNDYPVDALAGFLPPENGSGRGQGRVNFSIRPKPNTPMNTTITNKASIIFDDNEPIITNEVSNIVGEAVDLALSAQGPSSVTAGNDINYVFTVFNDGPNDAANVVFTYNLPTGATLVSSAAGWGSCNEEICTIGYLPAGQKAEITLVINYGTVGTLTSSATVTNEGAIEINPANNNTVVKTQLLNGALSTANLVLQVQAPQEVRVGSDVTLQFTIVNNGPDSAENVTFVYQLPVGAIFVSSSPSQGSCDGTDCTLGTLARSASAIVTIVIRFTTSGTMVGAAHVSTTTNDADMSNNTLSVRQTVLEQSSSMADVAVIVNGPSQAKVGDTLLLQFTVSNHGPGDAETVQFHFTLSGGATLISATAGQGVCTATTCDLGMIPQSSSVTVTFQIQLNAPRTVVASATVTSGTPESNATNNTVSIAIGVSESGHNLYLPVIQR